MGAVYVTIELENTTDADNAEAGLRPPDQIRRHSLRSPVDTGAVLPVLLEEVVSKLGLKLRGSSMVAFADDRKVTGELAGPVTRRVGARQGIFECLVGPPASEALTAPDADGPPGVIAAAVALP